MGDSDMFFMLKCRYERQSMIRTEAVSFIPLMVGSLAVRRERLGTARARPLVSCTLMSLRSAITVERLHANATLVCSDFRHF